MTRRPVLADLYCCAGGAGMGYYRAGFDVIGFDKDPQPNYPFPFVQCDVLGLAAGMLSGFDAIHASPPCQFATALNNDKSRHINLIPATRDLLRSAGVPYIIENVEGAAEHLIDPVMLCGSSFGLGADGHELQRHRLFEASFAIETPPCAHSGAPVVGVYGGHARNRSVRHGGRGTRDVWTLGHRETMRAALGMDWGTTAELSEAIPPTFTEYLGAFLLGEIYDRRSAAIG